MQLFESSVSNYKDQRDMAALVLHFPHAHLHVGDLDYRLASWAMDDPANTRLWRDENGQLVAWTVLQTPFWSIDYACHPAVSAALTPRVLAWADAQARALVDSPYGHPAWFVAMPDDQAEQIQALEAAGFESQANVEKNPWSDVLMELPLPLSVHSAFLPNAFNLRPLAGESEVDAYVELHRHTFDSKSMTGEWRSRTLKQPAYRSDCDMVIVAPDGRLAAFCIGWLATLPNGTVAGQIEPMGVHVDFRTLGLGRAILVETCKRLAQAGATRVFVETNSYRNAALALYESVGFRIIRTIPMFRKNYPSTDLD